MLYLSLLLLVSVEYSQCDENHLVFTSPQNTYEIDFFNVLFYDEHSRLEACNLIQKASTIELERELLAKDAYYIYIDDRLLQKVVIDQELARVNINYPEYLHQFEKDEVITVAQYEQMNTNNSSIIVLSTLILLLGISIGITLSIKTY